MTADEIADSLLGLVDFVRRAQRGFVDFAAGGESGTRICERARAWSTALLVGMRVHEAVTLNDIARVTVTRPLGARMRCWARSASTAAADRAILG